MGDVRAIAVEVVWRPCGDVSPVPGARETVR